MRLKISVKRIIRRGVYILPVLPRYGFLAINFWNLSFGICWMPPTAYWYCQLVLPTSNCAERRRTSRRYPEVERSSLLGVPLVPRLKMPKPAPADSGSGFLFFASLEKQAFHGRLKQKTHSLRSGLWRFKWYLQESNQGHTDFQSVALPTELRYQDVRRTPPGHEHLSLKGGGKYNFIFRKNQQNREKRDGFRRHFAIFAI